MWVSRNCARVMKLTIGCYILSSISGVEMSRKPEKSKGVGGAMVSGLCLNFFFRINIIELKACQLALPSLSVYAELLFDNFLGRISALFPPPNGMKKISCSTLNHLNFCITKIVTRQHINSQYLQKCYKNSPSKCPGPIPPPPNVETLVMQKCYFELSHNIYRFQLCLH